MDYLAVEEKLKTGYREVTAQYRRDDEIEVTTENHRRLGGVLQRVCSSFSHPIRVLDVGCGTGRYFHCLSNVEKLVGIDISEEMLSAAAHPVKEQEISVRNIELRRGNVYLDGFPSGSFDFIYSLGMFGHGCPVTPDILNRFYEWLGPTGRLFFNIVDMAGLPLYYRARRRLRLLVYPGLPRGMKRRLDEREQRSPFFSLTQKQLGQVMRRSRFPRFSLVSNECDSPLWNGRKLECLAGKEAAG